MPLEDILALTCVISFGGWVVSCYYIWKYSKSGDKKFSQTYEQSDKELENLRLQRKITGIVAIISFILFNLVYEK